MEQQLLRRMFRLYVKLCHGVTVIRGCTGRGLQAKAGNTACTDSSGTACKYGVVADAHGHMARYATSRGQGQRQGSFASCISCIMYHARAHVRYRMRATERAI